jgi:hypothetical protein
MPTTTLPIPTTKTTPSSITSTICASLSYSRQPAQRHALGKNQQDQYVSMAGWDARSRILK